MGSVSTDMARDTGDTETSLVRRKKGAKEVKEAKVNTRKEKKTVKAVEEEKKISADIQQDSLRNLKIYSKETDSGEMENLSPRPLLMRLLCLRPCHKPLSKNQPQRPSQIHSTSVLSWI